MIDNSLMGTLSCNGTLQAGVAGTGEQTLMTYTLPANSLRRNGQRLRIRATFLTGANGNNKTFKLYFGAASISTGTLTNNAKIGFLELDVIRLAAASQQVIARGQIDTTAITGAVTAGTDDETTALTIKLTGQGGTSGVDCTAEMLLVEGALEA